MKNSLPNLYQSLSTELAPLLAPGFFGPGIAAVYNPLEYAWAPFAAYLDLVERHRPQFLFLGMNPGPWGMTQTGIPFGNVDFVREWLRLEGPVGKPPAEHPARPVQGFACPKKEVSGQRLWGFFSRLFADREAFFARAAVLSFCPLVFMGPSGVNITPDKLPGPARQKLEAVCRQSLAQIAEVLQPQAVFCLGKYAEQQAAAVNLAPRLLLPHPSPANPQANNWAETVEHLLRQAGWWEAFCP